MKNTGIFKIPENGTQHVNSAVLRNRITYFNAVLVTLPLVYAIFILLDLQLYIKPLHLWSFDQFGFFIFASICVVCFVLNRFNWSTVSKFLFLLSWPAIMHIIPVIIQNTPPDYYIAYALGLLFHSVMIHLIFCSKKNPQYFWPILSH